VKKNPDVIIIANPVVSVEEVIGRVGWDEVLAVKHARVHRIDASLVSRPGPRAIDGAVELHRLIYPRRPAKEAGR
jgi:ABC-type Fe3+-hydroxamate transport system substrate-binding protein